MIRLWTNIGLIVGLNEVISAAAEKPGRRKNRRAEYNGMDDGDDGDGDVIKRTANGALIKRVPARSSCAAKP